jgi:hypothetical protein
VGVSREEGEGRCQVGRVRQEDGGEVEGGGGGSQWSQAGGGGKQEGKGFNVEEGQEVERQAGQGRREVRGERD